MITVLIGEMRHEHFPVFHPPYSCYFLQLLIVIVSFRFLHCNVIYLAHAYILYFQISNCNVFVCLCNFSFFKVSYCNCFYCNDFCRLGQSQTYPEEERQCLSKYWKGKIYFPNREISLALILFMTTKQLFKKNSKIQSNVWRVFFFQIEALLSLKNVWLPQKFFLDTKSTSGYVLLFPHIFKPRKNIPAGISRHHP